MKIRQEKRIERMSRPCFCTPLTHWRSGTEIVPSEVGWFLWMNIRSGEVTLLFLRPEDDRLRPLELFGDPFFLICKMGNFRVAAPDLKCRKLGHDFTTMWVFPSHCCWAALDCKLWCPKKQISLADSCATCRCRVRGYWRIRMHRPDWRIGRIGGTGWGCGSRTGQQRRSTPTELVRPPGEAVVGAWIYVELWKGECRDAASLRADRLRLGQSGKGALWLEEKNKCGCVNQSGTRKQRETCGKSAQNGSKTKPSFAEPPCKLQGVETVGDFFFWGGGHQWGPGLTWTPNITAPRNRTTRTYNHNHNPKRWAWGQIFHFTPIFTKSESRRAGLNPPQHVDLSVWRRFCGEIIWPLNKSNNHVCLCPAEVLISAHFNVILTLHFKYVNKESTAMKYLI